MNIAEKSVIQSNPLLEAKKDMTVSEMRLFCIGLVNVMPNIKNSTKYNEEFPMTLIPPSDLERLFNGNTGAVANLRRSIKKAFDSSIEIREENGSFWLRHLYEEMRYVPQEGLYIQFDKKMRPFLLDLLDKQYTAIKVKEIFYLSSEYAWRIMELVQEKLGFLKENDKAFVPVMTLDELKFTLNVPEGAYQGRMDNFRRKVLDEPIGEINKNTPYHVWYETRKTGRRISGFQIWVKKKTTEEKEQKSEEKEQEEIEKALKNEAVRKLVAAGIAVMTASALISKHGEQRVLANLRYAQDTITERTKNRPGYIISCIEKDYAKGQDLFEAAEAERKAKVEAEAEAMRKKIEDEIKEDLMADAEIDNPELMAIFTRHKHKKAEK